MTTTAIICEFNPLHSGHKKLIDYAKTFSDRIVCIMSGNFTQRGMPACADKYSRAKHAVLSGADLVVELPTIYAIASAENFALGGVQIANILKVNNLLFGSECGDISQLQECAVLLDDSNINRQIASELSKGVSYPKAVATALDSHILESPNNILAIEYLRAIKKTRSNIVPVTVKRENNYNGTPQQFASSAALRNDKALRNLYSYDFVSKDIDDSIELQYKGFATGILALYEKTQLSEIEGVIEGLENRIFNADKTCGYDKMIEEIKSKRYTRLKLQRIILNAILNITKETAEQSKQQKPEIKVLAVKSDKVNLLAGIENKSDKLTLKADRLYYSLSNKVPPTKLIKID